MSASPEFGRTRRLQYRFTAHLRDPKSNPVPAGIEDRRMAIYRDLVFSNVEMFLSANFPVIRNLYSDADWNVMTRDFLRAAENVVNTLSPKLVSFDVRFVAQPKFPRNLRRAFVVAEKNDFDIGMQ